MAERGAPVGNQNARNGRIWRDTLRRALLAEDGRRMRAIADALVSKAEDGDVAAIKEIGDRIDGKAIQSVEMSGPDGGTINANVSISVLPVSAKSDG